MVDEWVAVALEVVGGIVALDFLIAHRVLTVPFEHQIQVPRLIHWIAGSVENGASSTVVHPTADLRVVASSHVEIGARKVALVFIIRFPYGAGIAWRSAVTQTTLAVVAIV